MSAMVINTLPVEMEDEGIFVPAEQLEYKNFIRPNVHGDFDGINERVDEARAKINKSVAYLSLEGLAVFEQGTRLTKGFLDGLKYILFGISSTIDLLIKHASKAKADERDYSKFLKFAELNDYYAVAERVKLYQVARLGVRWYEYVQALQPHVEVASKIDDEVLTPFRKFLAEAINRPSLLASATYQGVPQRKDVDSLQNKLRNLFNDRVNEYVSWGKAFKNNGEVKLMFEEYSKLQKQIKTLKPETVKKEVAKLSETADHLFQAIEEEREGFELNKNQLKHLSEALFASAKFVEYYTVIVQLMYEFDTCLAVSQKKQLK